MVNVVSLFDIIAGLILLTGVMPLIPAIGKALEKVTKAMAAYQVPIGVIAVILGILGLIGTVSAKTVPSLFAIIAGIVLAISVFGALPKIGEMLKKVAMAIGGVQVIFGIITLIIGIVYI
jgi:hypothetical protein